MDVVAGVVLVVAAVWTAVLLRRSRTSDGAGEGAVTARPAAGEMTALDLYRDHPGEHQLIGAPMVPTASGPVTLRDRLVHFSERREQVWPEVVTTFYDRAAARPDVAAYFADADMARLQRHFLATLTMMAGQGLRVDTLTRMESAHAAVRDAAGRPITPEVYEVVMTTLVTVLAEEGVPEVTLDQLGAIARALRDVIVPVAA